MAGNTPVEIDFLIAADAAQVVDGKLWMLGGAWDTIHVSRLPVAHSMAIAAGINLSWDAAAVPHRFLIEIRDVASGAAISSSSGEFEQGQPADLEPGTVQRFMIAISGNFTFSAAGEHVIVLTVDGVHTRRSTFRVISPA